MYAEFMNDVSEGLETYPVIINSALKEAFQKMNYTFKYVTTNVPGSGCDMKTLSERFVGCSCEETCVIETCSCLQHFGQAYKSDGSRRLLDEFIQEEISSRPILECGNECKCNIDNCSNRNVQNGTNTKFYVFGTSEKGFGLKVSENVKKDSFVCEYAGEIVGKDEAKRRLKCTDLARDSNYLIVLREHVSEVDICTYIDPRFIGNLGRFINHSCDPNLVMVPVRVDHSIPRLALFARKDLNAEDELTFDYSGQAGFIKYSCQSSQKGSQCNESVKKGAEEASLEINQESPRRLKLEVDVAGENIHAMSKHFSFTSPDEKNCKTQRPCLCGSQNCSGFLPFDASLLI